MVNHSAFHFKNDELIGAPHTTYWDRMGPDVIFKVSLNVKRGGSSSDVLCPCAQEGLMLFYRHGHNHVKLSMVEIRLILHAFGSVVLDL